MYNCYGFTESMESCCNFSAFYCKIRIAKKHTILRVLAKYSNSSQQWQYLSKSKSYLFIFAKRFVKSSQLIRNSLLKSSNEFLVIRIFSAWLINSSDQQAIKNSVKSICSRFLFLLLLHTRNYRNLLSLKNHFIYIPNQLFSNFFINNVK